MLGGVDVEGAGLHLSDGEDFGEHGAVDGNEFLTKHDVGLGIGAGIASRDGGAESPIVVPGVGVDAVIGGVLGPSGVEDAAADDGFAVMGGFEGDGKRGVGVGSGEADGLTVSAVVDPDVSAGAGLIIGDGL